MLARSAPLVKAAAVPEGASGGAAPIELFRGARLAIVMVICVLAGIGTAGVPAGSIPVIAMILGMFGIPPEGLGLILGIDRFLDMCRTTLNMAGDLAAAVFVARGEAEPAREAAPAVQSAA